MVVGWLVDGGCGHKRLTVGRQKRLTATTNHDQLPTTNQTAPHFGPKMAAFR